MRLVAVLLVRGLPRRGRHLNCLRDPRYTSRRGGREGGGRGGREGEEEEEKGGRRGGREGEREGGTDGGSGREEREGGEGGWKLDKLSILLPSPSLSRRAMTCTMH